jgi:hypothetical protein
VTINGYPNIKINCQRIVLLVILHIGTSLEREFFLRKEMINLIEFNKVNEKIKDIISRFQNTESISIEELKNCHNALINLLINEEYYEDYRISLINALNKIVD